MTNGLFSSRTMVLALLPLIGKMHRAATSGKVVVSSISSMTLKLSLLGLEEPTTVRWPVSARKTTSAAARASSPAS